MRDIVLLIIFIGIFPPIFSRPDHGVRVFCWISYMNPHRLCYGFASTFPFAQLTAVATLLGFLASKEPKKIPWSPSLVLILLFLIWMFITTYNALNQVPAWVEFNQVWKIQLMTFLIAIIMTDRERVDKLVWVMVVSLGYYGMKGGLGTIITGGSARIWGPEGTFIGGNNEIGLAILMTLPLARYLQLNAKAWYLRYGLLGGMALCVFGILGTQSRGALVGMGAVMLFLILKSRNKGPLLLALAITVPLALSVMPSSWYERMNTIKTYEQDGSAMGRIGAWMTAIKIANDRITGGGYKVLHSWALFHTYASKEVAQHDAHSIYFEVLGEHGYPGLILFLGIYITAWRHASKSIKLAGMDPEKKWIADLCSMIQVSLVAYAVAGAFLGLAMFDFYYNLIAVVAACHAIALKPSESAAAIAETSTVAAPQRRRASFVKPPIDKQPKPVANRHSSADVSV